MAAKATRRIVTLEVFVEDNEADSDIPADQAIHAADAWIAEHEPTAGWVRDQVTRYWSNGARALVVYVR